MADKQNARVPIRETFILPSHGKVYQNIPEKITLRAMTTMDEKIRLSSSGISSFVALLNACIVEPEDIDASEFKMFDLLFLIYKLRCITYGSEDYKVAIGCPSCGRDVEISTNLDDIPVNYMDGEAGEPFDIGPLPVSKDVLTCKFLSVKDILNIEQESKKMLSKFKEYVGDPEFVLGYKFMITAVNGDILPDFKLMNYVENMHARDLMYFDSKYDSITGNYGMDLIRTDICPFCGSDIKYQLPVTDEFFRPRY